MHGCQAHESKRLRLRCLAIPVRNIVGRLCGAIIAHKKIGKDFSSPKHTNSLIELLLIELYCIADVHRLHREHDHSRRGRGSSPDDYNFSNPSARHLAGIDDRPVPTV